MSGKWETSGATEHTKECHDSSTGCIRKQYAFHHTCTKGKSAKRS